MLVQLAILAVFMIVVVAIPEVAFPFSSQVPALARVGELYKFQLAPTTFTHGSSAELSYKLINAPAWLNLDSQSLILYGTPGQGNSGSIIFNIIATNMLGSANMGCTLVVTSDAAPRMIGNLSAVLADSGTLSGPTSLSLDPNEAFTLAFGRHFFEAGSGDTKVYYATLSDHTPLPSWLGFEESSLAFLGVAPGLSGGPQSWTVDLIASDVVGFAGVVATFTLSISTKQLVFTPQSEDVTISEDNSFTFNRLMSQLSLNGQNISRGQIRETSEQAPSWLTFHDDTLALEGTPPKNFQSGDVKISITDIYGDVATKTIHIRGRNASLFMGEIESLTATAGTLFTYTIKQSLFSQSNLDISVSLGTADSWLKFDPDTMQLRGTPPATEQSQKIGLVLNAAAADSSIKESRPFELKLQAAPLGEAPTFTTSISHTSTKAIPTLATHTSPVGEAINKHASSHRDTKAGVAVAIVVGCIAFAALVIAVAMFLCRRSRNHGPLRPSDKLKISLPTPLEPGDPSAGVWGIAPGVNEIHDIEKGTRTQDRPPQLDLSLERGHLGTPPAGYQRSTVSSIGDGEAALLADPNIPIFGITSAAAHTPHHSYSAATEFARKNSQSSYAHLSQFARLSPRKRKSRLQSWHSQQSNQFRTSLHGSILRHPDRKSRLNSVLTASRDHSSTCSINTHGTSLLSAHASDFPEPPLNPRTRKSAIPTLAVQSTDNRRSIRLVSHSHSITDERPLAEKRQSFIRDRASSSIVSPLFASSRRSSNQRDDITNNNMIVKPLNLSGSVNGSLARNRSQRTFFSASSSLEPPARNPRRLASTSNSLTPSLRRPGSVMASRSRLGSPVRGIPEDMDADGDYYTTTTSTGTPASLPQSHPDIHSHQLSTSPSAAQSNGDQEQQRKVQQAATADLMAQLALPRHERSFVVPGEASPTPPPSSISREREAARRKWASKLKRNSRGHCIASAHEAEENGTEGGEEEEEDAPVVLRDVAQKFGRRKMDAWGEKIGGDGGAQRLSLLVSRDSVNGAMRKKAMRGPKIDARGEQKENLEGQGLEGNESEWEDVVSRRSSWMRPRSGKEETPSSTFSGKAFI